MTEQDVAYNRAISDALIEVSKLVVDEVYTERVMRPIKENIESLRIAEVLAK